MTYATWRVFRILLAAGGALVVWSRVTDEEAAPSPWREAGTPAVAPADSVARPVVRDTTRAVWAPAPPAVPIPRLEPAVPEPAVPEPAAPREAPSVGRAPDPPSPAPSARAESPNGWRVLEGKDPLDGSDRVTLWLGAVEGPAATLLVECRASRLSVNVVWPVRLADPALLVRVGDGRARLEDGQWALEPDSVTLAYRGDPRRFLRELDRQPSWAAAPASRGAADAARFDALGLADAAAPLRSACRWP